MRNVFKLFVAAAVAAIVPAQFAAAGQVTNQFNVLINIAASCTIETSTIPDMDFGTAITPDTTNIDTTTAFDVQCTTGTSPQISLVSTLDGAERRMVGIDSGVPSGYDNTSAKIHYKLFSDSTRSTAWTNTDQVSFLDDGSLQTITVYGRVPDTGTTVGNFKDVVTVNVDF